MYVVYRIYAKIDTALSNGDFHALMEMLSLNDFKELFSNEVTSPFQEDNLTAESALNLRRPGIDMTLLLSHAKLISQYEKQRDDYAQNVCCSCEQLHRRKNVTVVKFSHKLGGSVWPSLKDHMLKNNPKAAEQSFFMCNYCKSKIKRNNLPSRCILNDMHLVPVPKELYQSKTMEVL